MSKITVHRFKKFDIVQGVEIESAYYATAESIKQFEAAAIAGSAIEIDGSMLDSYGRYKPKEE